jgi:cysteinyl-tRNA synthetase
LKSTLNALVFDVLGLQTIEENNNEKLDQTLQVLIELRNQARKSKNFELSDQIAMILAEGIELKDGRDGTLCFELIFFKIYLSYQLSQFLWEFFIVI